ncbi:hypothetical protein JTB14_032515 [Gonioctena quinquepunctata]|nr:hypothetical protein JTB14_032515 [Gonioctena quinquepunctata]
MECVRCYKLVRKLPGPELFPLLGNIPDLICDDDVFFKKLRKWARQHGPIYRLAAAYFTSVNISGAEEFEAVAATMKNIEKAPIYTFLERWLGDGLLRSTGTKWQTRRKILTPAFHFTILQQFVTVFNNETDRLVDVLKKEVGKSWTNIVPLISEFTLYTIAESSMGTKLNKENKEDKRYMNSIYQMGKMIFYRVSRPWLFFQRIYYNITFNGIRERKLIEIIHNFTDNIIGERTKNFETFKQNDDNYCYSQKKRLAFLDLLLNAKIADGILDDQGIRDEVNTFMFEVSGFDLPIYY